jgi:hypothetical protein
MPPVSDNDRPRGPGPVKIVNRGAAGLRAKIGPQALAAAAEAAGVDVAENEAACKRYLEEYMAAGRKDVIAPGLAALARPIAGLKPDPMNARVHGARNMDAIMLSLAMYGQVKPIVVRKETGVVVAGNGTLAAAQALGWRKIAANIVSMTDTEAWGYGLADNRTAELASWDLDRKAQLTRLVAEAEGCLAGYNDDELTILLTGAYRPPDAGPNGGPGDSDPAPKVSLADRFLVPPFSVLDARQGYWQARKRAWLALGIQSELGRGVDLLDLRNPGEAQTGGKGLSDNLTKRLTGERSERVKDGKDGNGLLGFSAGARSHYKAKQDVSPGGSPRPAMGLGADGRTLRGDGAGRPLAQTFGSGRPGDLAAGFRGEVTDSNGTPGASGTSIFDPVLCELSYSWFCPAGGMALDPFAGGSVRGIVAAKLGRGYVGIDLSAGQIAANREQAKAIVPANPPSWHAGDSLEILPKLLAARKGAPTFDLLFSCPPYADLERYSDDPRDISTMGYDNFLEAYAAIIAHAVALLRPDRFAVWVVGDIRGPGGAYRGLVRDTVDAFAAVGAQLYNDAVLVTAVGSLPIRVGRQFAGARKLGKTHQNVLVFVKGDPAAAAKACGEVSIWVPEAAAPEAGAGDTDEAAPDASLEEREGPGAPE